MRRHSRLSHQRHRQTKGNTPGTAGSRGCGHSERVDFPSVHKQLARAERIGQFSIWGGLDLERQL